MILIKRKPGMSFDDFVDYYENVHSKLASRVPNLRRYARNFIRPYGNDVYAGAAELPFDVVTEICFDDEAEFHKGMAYLTEPETAAIVAADEENLFDRSSIIFVTADERVSNLGG
ncbi:EthD domain-containing protein [Sphingobium sp. CFD-2]|uniref:EthD domain-containing protein n=1 Tax=Sphingobium sp. CFD-2 TaxID=2878542 RepID=UPI00214AE789|nr:EthD domain-containing protein [Sphingobium sp. CFD-2]